MVYGNDSHTHIDCLWHVCWLQKRKTDLIQQVYTYQPLACLLDKKSGLGVWASRAAISATRLIDLPAGACWRPRMPTSVGHVHICWCYRVYGTCKQLQHLIHKGSPTCGPLQVWSTDRTTSSICLQSPRLQSSAWVCVCLNKQTRVRWRSSYCELKLI